MQVQISPTLTIDIAKSRFHPDARKCCTCGNTDKLRCSIAFPVADNRTIVRFLCPDCPGYMDLKYCNRCKMWLPAIAVTQEEKKKGKKGYFAPSYLKIPSRHDCSYCHDHITPSVTQEEECDLRNTVQRESRDMQRSRGKRRRKTQSMDNRCPACLMKTNKVQGIRSDDGSAIYLCEKCYQRVSIRIWDTDRMHKLADFVDADSITQNDISDACAVCQSTKGNRVIVPIRDVSIRMCSECYRIYCAYSHNTILIRNTASIIAKFPDLGGKI